MSYTTPEGSPDGRAPVAGRPKFPITIADWREAQLKEGGLERLLLLAEQQSAAGTPEWIAVATPEDIKKQWGELEARRQSQGPSRRLGRARLILPASGIVTRRGGDAPSQRGSGAGRTPAGRA